ncbi:MAG TPA: Ig-like domain-containing protein [Pyrinomonadaceae bacterium]|nr:Ig-like domain-containing protein [Pyrinomonadaceae bacterium]
MKSLLSNKPVFRVFLLLFILSIIGVLALRSAVLFPASFAQKGGVSFPSPNLATTLAANDIAIVSYNSDNPDAAHPDGFSFVILRAIGSGTVINFTDKGWTSGGAFSNFAGDSVITFTAATDLAAGTVIASHSATGVLNPQFSGALDLAEAGDQIIAYQGSAATPTLLYAIDFADGNTSFAANATTANNSALPSALSIGTTAVAIAGDNASFAGPTNGLVSSLRSDIGDFNSWVSNDNSPQTLINGPFLLAPDRQLWVAGSGAGEAIVHIHGDGTVSSGNVGFNLVQLFQNEANLFHPSDIALDTVHDKYFFVDADLNGHNRIIQASISTALNNPGATPTFTVLYSNNGTGATGSMRTLSLDTANGIIYFDIATTFNKIVYDTPNQTPTQLANLGSNNYVTQATIDYAHGEVYLGSSRITSVFGSDVVTKNYIYRATGLTSASATLTFSQLPFNPDDNDPGPPNHADTVGFVGLAGEAWPVERGTVRGVDVDPVNRVLYLVTGSVRVDTSAAGDGSEFTTYLGGVWAYNLVSNPNGDVSLVYQQNGSTGPVGLLYYMEVDPNTNKYYVVDETGTNADPGDGGVWIGNTSGGTPTLFSLVANVNGLGPQGLELDTAPTLTVVTASPTYTEQQSSPTTVQLISSATANDIDARSLTDQLAGATVRISSGFFQGVDTLSFTPGGGISGSYNSTTGVLTLTGVSSFSNYQTVLASVRFQATGDNPTNYGTNASRTISWAVSDGLLTSDEQSSVVTVVGVNDPPVNTNGGANPRVVNEDTNLSFNLLSISDVDADPNSQQLVTTLAVANGTLTVGSVGGGALVSGSTTGTVTLTGTSTQINTTLGAVTNVVYRGIQDFNGTDPLTITTNDQGNTPAPAQSDSDLIGITVNPVNDAPTLNAISNPAAILEDAGLQTVNLSGISEGPTNESSQTLTITAVSNNTGLIPNPTVSFVENSTTGSLSYTPVADTSGSATITVTVTDSGGTASGGVNSLTRTFTVNVTAVNDAPTLNTIADTNILEDAAQQTVGLTGISNGPNETGQVNSISATSDNPGLIPNPAVIYTSPNATGSLTFTPVANMNGSAVVTVTISDNGGTANGGINTLSRTFTVNVAAVNDAPTLDPIANPADIAENSPQQTINFSGVGAGDSEIQSLVVTATSNNPTLIPNPSVSYTSPQATGSLNYTPVAGQAGDAVITVTVGDSGGTANGGVDSFSRTFNVHVIAIPDIFARDARAAEPSSGMTNMLFTVALSSAPTGPLSVNYATADGGVNPATGGTCSGGADYEITSGTLNFAAGQTLATVPLVICSDANTETDETLLLNLTTPVGGSLVRAQAVGTITAVNNAGEALINEVRTSGPNGPGDEFVEIYNNSDSPVTVAASDASAGLGLFKLGADCNATPVLVGTIPNGTVIPARGHYLFVGSTYSLGSYSAGDSLLTSDIPNDSNLGLFATADPSNLSSDTRIDAVGFGTNTGGAVCDLLREGTNLQPATGSTSQYSFVRALAVSGVPKDANDNATDFMLLSTTPSTPVGSNVAPQLGAPGPESLASPTLRNNEIITTLIDVAQPPASLPNRIRNLTPDPANNSTFGTLEIRRKFINNTGAPITRLRFRIVDITSFPVPSGIADLRVRSSSPLSVTITGGATITVQGSALETPSQPIGGALNSSLDSGTITLATPLAPGAEVNVRFLLGVQQTGYFKFFISLEALANSAPPPPIAIQQPGSKGKRGTIKRN